MPVYRDCARCGKDTWISVRQRAGPLVKEVRYQRPTLSKGDLPSVRREKNEILRHIRDSSFRRTPVDRLELMLALFGHSGQVYCLTFEDQFLPSDFKGVRRVWRNFLNTMRRYRGRPFDYVYVIEGKHGDHRYHIHMVLHGQDFTPAEVRYLWPGGHVDHEPLLLSPQDDFRRTAKYFTKERTDGVVLPIGSRTWVASRGLYQQLPPIQKTTTKSGQIRIPSNCRRLRQETKSNPFGQYHYASYLRLPS